MSLLSPLPKSRASSIEKSIWAWLRFVVFIGTSVELNAGSTAAQVGFNRDVRPIMSNTCFKCHGPDIKNNKSPLRLDLPNSAFAPYRNAKGTVFTPLVPGKPEQSEVWRRVSSVDPQERMPPAESLHQLTAQDKAMIKRWIEQGAKYEQHWSYMAPTKAPLPDLGVSPSVQHPIDLFIREKLAARKIAPSSEVDRPTLVRRLSLDLRGLPPTVEEVETFMADRSHDAYSRLVDTLLASPHYGERMAIPWLDSVRFADSVGFHGDQLINNFSYRDYVIDAFNRNLPFDQFTVEQLAGDLLPNATVNQRVATGFNRLNMVTREGGAQAKEYLAKYATDRVRTVSTTWLGSTMACAECHDHKYDPTSTRDFYALSAFFADIKQYGVYADYRSSPEPDLRNFSNHSPFPPEIVVDSPYQQRRLAHFRRQFQDRVTATAQSLLQDPVHAISMRLWTDQTAARLRGDTGGWSVATVERALAEPPAISTAAEATVPSKDERAPKEKVKFALLTDGGVRIEGTAVAGRRVGEGPHHGEEFSFELRPPVGPTAALRLEIIPDEVNGGKVARGNNASCYVNFTLALIRAGENLLQPLAIAEAYTALPTENYFNGQTLPSLLEGWLTHRNLSGQRQAGIYLLRHPLTFVEGDRLVIKLASRNVGRVRFAVSPLGGRLEVDAAPEIVAAFTAFRPTPVQQALLAEQYFLGTGAFAADVFTAALADLSKVVDCHGGRAASVVTEAVDPVVTRVLPRGNWQDESGEIVQPAPPQFLPGGGRSAGSPRQSRLDLARWITARQNPLTARVFVNRLWQQFFGTGLSATLDDLGLQGEYPSHPELLDWLAVEFMDRGWDVKALVRLIVTSSTYRQQSRFRPELAEIDPGNRLLARQNFRRLDAEFVRDNALFVAGLLNPDIGGPSVRPYQPEGYYASLNNPLREYVPDTDDRQYRRGIYMHRQRTFLHPMLANFDATSREECTSFRTQSNTPQQALTLLNDPTFVEAARVLAQRVLSECSDSDFAGRLDYASRRLLARPLPDRDRQSLDRFFTGQLDHFRKNREDALRLVSIGLSPKPDHLDLAEFAAWTSVARVLLNRNEAITRN